MAKLAGQPFHHTHQSAHILPSKTLKCEASISSIQTHVQNGMQISPRDIMLAVEKGTHL